MNYLKEKLKDINAHPHAEIEYAPLYEVIELLYEYEDYHTIRCIYNFMDKIAEDVRRKREQ